MHNIQVFLVNNFPCVFNRMGDEFSWVLWGVGTGKV